MKKNIGPIMLMCLLGGLEWDACGKNPGGLYDGCWYGEIADVDTWPEPLAVPLVLGDGVVALDPIVMLATKKMYPLYTTQDTSEVSDEMVGEVDGKSFETFFEYFSPGTYAELLDLAATFANGNFFFVVRERGGNYRIIGGPGHPAKMDTSSIKTAKDAKGRKGWTAKVKTWGTTPAWIYDEQTIPL